MLGLNKSPGSWVQAKNSEPKFFSGESKESKLSNQDREMQTDDSSETYTKDTDEKSGKKELEIIAVCIKPFRPILKNTARIRANLENSDCLVRSLTYLML